MREKIHCAVIGLGRLGWSHAEYFAGRIPGAHLLAVADVIEDRAVTFAQQYGVPIATTDIEKVLSHPEMDAAVIVTPTVTHASLIQAAIAANKAVFVEKPMTHSLEEAAAITRLVEATHAYCQIGFMRRFDPSYRAMREQIHNGAIGKPLYFKTLSRDPGCPPRSYLQESGRIFVDMSVHDFDMARFLMDEEIVEVTALGGIVHNEFLRSHDDIDQALTFVRFASGTLGDIENSRIAGYGYDTRAEVVGTTGTIQAGALTYHDIRMFNSRGSTSDLFPGFLERFADAYYLELVDFIDRLRRGLPPAVTVEDGYKALALAMAATQSYDEKRPVQVKW